MAEKAIVTIKKATLWKTAAFVIGILFVLSLITGGFGILDNSDSRAKSVNRGTLQRDINAGVIDNVGVLIEDDDPVQGNKNAKISIVEFSDFQCPFCARAHFNTLADFRKSSYFKNSEVNLVYKHFPLSSIHPFAQKAAEASECAKKQGKFWEYHDMLFENQQALDISSLKQYAAVLGLNSAQFNKCLDSGETSSIVLGDLREATSAGGRGTPYFVLINNKNKNTQTISGAVPWSNFETAIQLLQ